MLFPYNSSFGLSCNTPLWIISLVKRNAPLPTIVFSLTLTYLVGYVQEDVALEVAMSVVNNEGALKLINSFSSAESASDKGAELGRKVGKGLKEHVALEEPLKEQMIAKALGYLLSKDCAAAAHAAHAATTTARQAAGGADVEVCESVCIEGRRGRGLQ